MKDEEPLLYRMAGLKPKVVAATLGSTFVGDGEQAVRDLARVGKEAMAGTEANRGVP